MLPQATVVVDHFHLVQLANRMVTKVRQRVTQQQLGRRGRRTDPVWANRRMLLRARERLSERAFTRMWNGAVDNDPSGQLLAAWIAKEELRAKGRIPDRDVTVLAMGGDGATADIGFQALSGMMERGHKVIYVCVDNEAYMNTGVQRSSSTPFGASTTTSPAGKVTPSGQTTWKKDMTAIAAAHGIPYTATACPSYYTDLMKKVQKAKEADGPAYLHVLSVCATGWRIPPKKSIEYGKLAVDSGVFPLLQKSKTAFGR